MIIDVCHPDYLRGKLAEAECRAAEWQALAEKYRKVLYLHIGDCRCKDCQGYRDILSTSATDALAAHDAEIIRRERERCAEVAVSHRSTHGIYSWIAFEIAAAIRRGEGK